MGRIAFLAVLALAACGVDDDPAATPTSADVTTTTVAADEDAYVDATAFTFGIGTNPEKMLEYGYDLCEMFESQPVADAIKDWALEEGQPLRVASTLGAAAADYLCP